MLKKVNMINNSGNDNNNIFNYLESNNSLDFLNNINFLDLKVLENENSLKVSDLNLFSIYLKNLKILNINELKKYY